MSIITVGLAVWVLAPALILIALVALMEWNDRRQWRRDERSLMVWMLIEEAWNLPPAERRHQR